MGSLSLVTAFGAGILSFVSPCVLPLIPGYVSFISGVTLSDVQVSDGAIGGGHDRRVARRRALISTLAFVLGFSLVFVSLGASATALGAFILRRKLLLGRLGGLLIVLFGLHTMGVLKIAWLHGEKRIHSSRKPAGPFGAVMVGIAFAFGWTPCIGPILSAILIVAANQTSISEGVRLLTAYSLGLGVPFLLTSLALDKFFAAFSRIRRHYRLVENASGGLLVAVGVLLATNRFSLIAQYLSPYLPSF